jgi:hypothetical protein
LTRQRGRDPSAGDEVVEPTNQGVYRLTVVDPPILDRAREVQAQLTRDNVYINCAIARKISRFIGVLEATRHDFNAFPEKNFLLLSPHTRNSETEDHPPAYTVIVVSVGNRPTTGAGRYAIPQ